MEVLKYEDFTNVKDNYTNLSAVEDTFHYKIKFGKEVYTWTKNERAEFQKRNFAQGSSSVILPHLQFSIDQCPCFRDFRYPEKRNSQNEPLSTQESKVDCLCRLEDKALHELGMDFLAGKSYDERKEYVEAHLYSSQKPISDISYSAVKKMENGQKQELQIPPTLTFLIQQPVLTAVRILKLLFYMRKIQDHRKKLPYALLHGDGNCKKQIIICLQRRNLLNFKPAIRKIL